MTEDEESGDLRVWKHKYETALSCIESGNIAEARKILSQLAESSPYEDIKKDAAAKLEQFKIDWVSYAMFGGTALVLIILIVKYVL